MMEMMRQQPKAIVIMGYSGAGKDLLASYLIQAVRGLEVVKFSNPIKTALAVYLGIDRRLFDDREYRVKPIPFLEGKSLLDLLVSSFEVMPMIHPRLGLYSTQNYVMRMSGIPIFNDTRNIAEAEWLTSYYQGFSEILPLIVQADRGVKLHSDRYQEDIIGRLSYRNYPVIIDNNGTKTQLKETAFSLAQRYFNNASR